MSAQTLLDSGEVVEGWHRGRPRPTSQNTATTKRQSLPLSEPDPAPPIGAHIEDIDPPPIPGLDSKLPPGRLHHVPGPRVHPRVPAGHGLTRRPNHRASRIRVRVHHVARHRSWNRAAVSSASFAAV